MAHRQADGARSCGRRPAALALHRRRSGRSAASADHRRRGAAVADLTNFDAARWPASAEETARAARRRRWRGDPAARAAGSGDAGVGPVGVHPEPSGRVAAATLQRLVGSLTESLGNFGPKLRIDGAASWLRDVRANCGAIVAAIVRHTTRRARPRWRAGAAIPRRAGRFGQVWLNSGRCAFGTRGPGRPAESSASCLCVPRARDGPASERPLRRCLEVCSNYKQCRTSRKSHGILVLCLLGESAG